MIDTVVHQMVSGGYNPYYNQQYRHHPPPRPMPRSSGRAPTAPTAPSGDVARVETKDAGGGGYVEPANPSHYTKTNVQERGVDEADIVKTDGKFVYTVHGNELIIAKTWPVEKTDVAARVTFKTIYPQQLYLRGNEVIVQGQANEALNGWNQGRTRVMVVDVENRMEPRIKRIIDVEGYASNSRVVGDDLYLVQNTAVQLPPKLYETAQKAMANVPRADQQTLRPWEVQSRLASTLRRSLLNSVTTADINSALPRVRSGSVTKQMACDDLYVPPNNIQMQMTTLAKISLSETKADLVGAMVAGGQIYASTDTLYVTAPFYSYNPQGGAEYSTQVHQFSLGDARTRPSYVASGKVEGSLLNQFSMSEFRGDLRIATTDWNWSGQQGGNNLFVMRPYGKTLSVIGSLRGLGKGERIYSGRMHGEQGYLVTFRQTDPLYTLDLSDPMNPKVAGELKINGFSSYIHPIGNGMLLTIGQDASDDGRVQGVHLQVFDVKDPARPTRKFHEKLGTGSYSTAQNDHHAFMYDPVTGTLAFPITQSANNEYFNGLAVYSFDKKRGFKSKGRIDHGALSSVWIQEQCEIQRKANPTLPETSLGYCQPQYQKQYRAQYPITRSMVVDKFILSLSSIGLEIHELGDLDVAATLSWAKVQKTKAIAR
jgi:uncharacterized secreted protein with C-terminal beta-propeller domain